MNLELLLQPHSQYNWDLNENLILDNYYDALVLTDNSQVIQWVNKGFSK